MNSNELRTLSLAALCFVATVRPAAAQSTEPEILRLLKCNTHEQGNALLDDAAIQSRIAVFSDTTKGQFHTEDAKQFETIATKFITLISAREAKKPPAHCSVPFYLQDERILDHDAMISRLEEISFPGVFALAEKKNVLLVDTLEQLEQLLEKRVPDEVRKGWAEHVSGSSRIALVSGGTMIVGLSLRKKEGEFSVSGILLAYFPTPDAPILKAIKGRLLERK